MEIASVCRPVPFLDLAQYEGNLLRAEPRTLHRHPPRLANDNLSEHDLVLDGPAFPEQVTSAGARSGNSLEFDNVVASCYTSEHPDRVHKGRNILKNQILIRTPDRGGALPANLVA